ncbi:MAG TPA: hypothetical protein VGE63_00795 [Candidatus Paceibacterota bacterium]
MEKNTLGIIAGCIALSAFVPFTYAILKGPAKPSIVTWGTWVVVNILLLKSYHDNGAYSTLWMPKAFLLGDIIICILSIRFGERKISRIDKAVIAVTILNIAGIIFYKYDKEVVLMLSVIALAIGGVPTMIKSWKRPYNEDKWVWSIFGLGAILNLVAVEDWSHWQIFAHPLYAVCVDVTIAIILWLRSGVKRPLVA